MVNPRPFRRSSSEPQFSTKTTPPKSKTLTLNPPSPPRPPPSSSSSSAPADVRLRSLHIRRISAPPAILGLYSPESASVISRSSILEKIQEWAPSCFYTKSSDADAENDLNMIVAEKTLRERVIPVSKPAAPNVPYTAAAVARTSREYVWAYKHRPRFLNEFLCNRDAVAKLLDMVSKHQCSHFIFEGHPGAGKRSMVLAFLRDVFGQEKLKTRYELKRIELKGEHHTSIDVNVRISSQHIEVNLSELRGYEKHVIVALMNEDRGLPVKALNCDHPNCQAIVLHEADMLSTDTQHYVRWVLEKYKGCSKIFFCCYDASRLQIIKQLCKTVKLQPPSNSEVVEVLEHIAQNEHIELSRDVAKRIAKNSKNNLRQAIRSFEASWKSNPSFKEDQVILTGWEEDIANIAKSIVIEQSPKLLYAIRGKLRKLIEHSVSPDFIFNALILELKKLLDDQFQTYIDALYQEYKIRDNECFMIPEKTPAFPLAFSHADYGDKFNDSRKNIHNYMRIEEFTAKFMSSYKSLSPRMLQERAAIEG